MNASLPHLRCAGLASPDPDNHENQRRQRAQCEQYGGDAKETALFGVYAKSSLGVGPPVFLGFDVGLN
ncbi:MAG: hypothetical protein AAFQ87_16485 [Bacteroidota bacterium]